MLGRLLAEWGEDPAGCLDRGSGIGGTGGGLGAGCAGVLVEGEDGVDAFGRGGDEGDRDVSDIGRGLGSDQNPVCSGCGAHLLTVGVGETCYGIGCVVDCSHDAGDVVGFGGKLLR